MPTADINSQFRQMLGRDATSEELSYLGRFLNEGQLSTSEIGTLLQAHPEYQTNLLNKNVDEYGQKLQTNDESILQRGADVAGVQAQSRFAGLGRPNSSAMAAQVFGKTGQIAQGLAGSRQDALARFYGQGLQSNAALAAQQGQATQARGYGLRDEERQRAYSIMDYYRQKNDAADARKSTSGWNALTPEFLVQQGVSLGGSALGGWMGGLSGMAGKAAGSALGSYLARQPGETGRYPSNMGPSWNGGR